MHEVWIVDFRSACKMQKHAPLTVTSPSARKVYVVYYLSYGGGFLEHPHLLEVAMSASSTGLCLKDVKRSLASLRGSVMLSSFSWSYKRSYKQAYVWQDLESDNALIFPTHGGSEYILKGCKIDSSCIMQVFAYPAPKSPGHSTFMQLINKVSTPVNPLIMKMAERDHLLHASDQSKAGHREWMPQESDIDMKLTLDGKAVPYGSKSFRNHALEDTYAGASVSSTYHVVDAATQTIEHNQLPIQLIRSKLACPSCKCVKQSHNEPSLTSTNREEMIYKQDSISQKLSREELYLPPSVSSSTTTTYLHSSTANHESVLSLEIDSPRPKISFHQSAHFSGDQMFQKAMIGLTNGNFDNGSPLSSTSLITSDVLGDSEQESYADPINYSFQNSKLASELINTKPHHKISVFSSSCRFLRLVPCVGGLEVVRPSRTSSDRSDGDHRDGYEESMFGAEIPHDDAKYGSSCMHTSLPNAPNNATALDSSLSYVVREILGPRYSSEVEVCAEFSTQEARSSNKLKLWHLKGWVSSHYKLMKKSLTGTSFVTKDGSHACAKSINIETQA